MVGDTDDIVFVQDTLRFNYGCEIKVMLASKEDLDRKLLHYYGDEPTQAEQHVLVDFQDIAPLHERIKKLEEERDELLYAFHAAITRHMGTVPASGDKFYDQNHPALKEHAYGMRLDTIPFFESISHVDLFFKFGR